MDFPDELLATAVACREAGMSRQECLGIINDTFDAPWGSGDFARRLIDRAFASRVGSEAVRS